MANALFSCSILFCFHFHRIWVQSFPFQVKLFQFLGVNIWFLPLPLGGALPAICLYTLCTIFFLAWLILVFHLHFCGFLSLSNLAEFCGFLQYRWDFILLSYFNNALGLGLNIQFVYFVCSLFSFLVFFCDKFLNGPISNYFCCSFQSKTVCFSSLD